MEETKINFALLKKIKLQGLRQRDFAQIVNEDESVISRVVNGVWNPSEAQRIRYARALKCKVSEIFGPANGGGDGSGTGNR